MVYKPSNIEDCSKDNDNNKDDINSNNSSSSSIRKIALVGKGLTFDSGGYNLKVSIYLCIYLSIYVCI
jgi:hypothetical protein